jgi:SGNH domain (fused to AT3 domains)
MWELLSGGFLAWITRYKHGACPPSRFERWLSTVIAPTEAAGRIFASVVSLLGVLFLAWGLCEIDQESAFPGNWALLPVLGAICIIWAGPNAWINRAVLSNRLMVSIGLISFPLYLWHWPILSFAKIVEAGALDEGTVSILLALTFLLAWLTYGIVEKPLRSAVHGRVKVAALVLMLVAIGFVGYETFRNDGLGFRTKDRAEFLAYFENTGPDWKFFKKLDLTREWRSECSFFNAKKYLAGQLEGGITDSKPVEELDRSCYERDSHFEKSVLIWGDSHAQSLSPGIVKNIPENWQVLQVASSACNPNPNVRTPSAINQCDQSNYFAMKTIELSKPDVVVVAQAKWHSLEIMAEISAQLRNLGIKKILFLGPVPQWKSDLPKIIARLLWLTKPQRTTVRLNQDTIEINKKLLKEFPPSEFSQYVDVIGLFCNSDGCLTRTGSDIQETITTWDYGHLTPSASNFLAKKLLLEKILTR